MCVLVTLHPRCGVVTNVVTSAGSAESVGSLVEALYEYVRCRFAMLIAMLIAYLIRYVRSPSEPLC